MKRKILSVLLIAGMSLTLGACSWVEEAFGQKVTEEAKITAPGNVQETTDNADVTTSGEAETNDGSEGGNPDISKYIDVTVSEDKYFYDNREIAFDDLIKMLEGLDGNTAVRITDENATLKAFEELTKALAEREILFEAAN